MAVAEDVRARRPVTRAGRRQRGFKPGKGWLVLPPTAYLLALLIFPIVLVGMYSVFLLTNLTGVITSFSYQDWLDFFPNHWSILPPWHTDSPFWNTFTKSMGITLLVSVVTTVAAYPVAYYLAFIAHRRRYVLLLVLLAPFFTSFLLRVLAWQVMLNNNGVINSSLWELGLRPQGDAISWLINTWFSVGLVLAYSWVPFVALPMFVTMENMDRRLIEAAQDLGASRFTTFLRVTLPLSLPGVIAGFVFVLIPTTGEFITPQLVGGAETYMFGQAIQDLFVGTAIDWNYGAVLSIWLMAIVIVLVSLSARFLTMDLREGET
jgi:spermidine/putrescine transport system permease protein